MVLQPEGSFCDVRSSMLDSLPAEALAEAGSALDVRSLAAIFIPSSVMPPSIME